MVGSPFDQSRANQKTEDGAAMIAAAGCLPLVLGKA
jgi:hypothetical protein